MKQCWAKGKVSPFHTPSTRHHQFLPPFQPKRKKMEKWEKKRSTPGGRTSKKTGVKLKERKLVLKNILNKSKKYQIKLKLIQLHKWFDNFIQLIQHYTVKL